MEQAPSRHQCTCFISITVPSYQPASQNITSKHWWSSKDSQGPLFLILCKPFASLWLGGDLQPILGYKFAIIMQISLLIKTSHYLMISNVIRHAVHTIFASLRINLPRPCKHFPNSYFYDQFVAKIFSYLLFQRWF